MSPVNFFQTRIKKLRVTSLLCSDPKILSQLFNLCPFIKILLKYFFIHQQLTQTSHNPNDVMVIKKRDLVSISIPTPLSRVLQTRNHKSISFAASSIASENFRLSDVKNPLKPALDQLKVINYFFVRIPFRKIKVRGIKFIITIRGDWK